MGSDNSYRINPILSNIIENIKVKSIRQDKQYREQVEVWKKLLAEKDPWIEPQKFIELFDMYDFDASEPEILCAFKPMIMETAETYCIERGTWEKITTWLKKHPELMNKINSQAQFDVDEQELDIFKAKLKKLSDSI